MYRNETIENKWYRGLFRGDKALWLVFFLLTAVSLVAVYSSIGRSAIEDDGVTPMQAFFKHFAFVVATYGLVMGVSRLDYRIFSRISQILLWISIALLLFLVFSHGKRWVVLPVIGRFQPSELAKVSLVIYVARLLSFKENQIETIQTFWRILIPIGAVTVLVFKENFSTAALIFLSCFATMLYGGVNKRYWWRLMLLGVVFVVGYLTYTYKNYERSLTDGHELAAQVVERESTWGHRVYSWVNPDTTQLTQESMARMAIARGRVFGVGIGNTVFARLMTQANNDFIYAIIIEETGMFGGLIILLLYSIFFFRCVKVAFRCQKPFGMLIAMGIGTVIYLQALVNMCVAVGVLPVTGQTLPFISSGGTAYLSLGLGVGVVQAVASDAQKREALAPQNSNTEEVEL